MHLQPRRTKLLSVFCNFEPGGAQLRFARLANRYPDVFDHSVIALEPPLDCQTSVSAEVTISYPSIIMKKNSTISNIVRFRRELIGLKPDVIATYDWGTIEWTLANAVGPAAPQVHFEDGFGPDDPDGSLRRRVLLRRVALRRATVVVPSQTLLRIATQGWGLPAHRVTYMPNGVDLRRFAPAADPGVRQNVPLTIGTVGGLRPVKNLARLLRAVAAFAQDHPLRLVIAGDGPERANLEELSAALGISSLVDFVGWATDPARLLRGFDIFALTSDTEQMPFSVLEAMASGLPVVATDVGDVRAMLAPMNRPFVVAKNDAALVSALTQLGRDPGLRRDIGLANRARAEAEFGEERMLAAYRAVIEDAAAGKAG
jgi:glycosyltransferase involved in cell wall biosynthesis